jgi:hypothetical protein
MKERTMMNTNVEVLSLESLSESELPEFSDESDNDYYRLKYGHILPLIDQIVSEVGSELQRKIYQLAIHEEKSFREIGTQLKVSKRYADLQLIGQDGLGHKIREELIQLGFINDQSNQ